MKHDSDFAYEYKHTSYIPLNYNEIRKTKTFSLSSLKIFVQETANSIPF